MNYYGIDHENEVYYTNVASCHPPSNKIPPGTSACCKRRLSQEIRPYWDAGATFMAAGAVAADLLYGPHRGSLRGKWIRGGRIICTWHPAYILRVPKVMCELMSDVAKLARGGPQPVPHVWHHIVESQDELDSWIDLLVGHYEGKVVCFDLETDQMIWWEHRILCAAFAFEENMAFVIPGDMIYTERTRRSLVRLFDSDVEIMGHNVKFDLRFIQKQLGVHNAYASHDSLIAHYTLNENVLHGLKYLLTEYFDIPDYEGVLVQRYLKTRADFYSKVPAPQLMEYNALDVAYNLRLFNAMREQLEEEGLWEMPYLYPMMASQRPLLDAELWGIELDQVVLRRLDEQMEAGAAALQAELEEMCGTTFNPNSWMQVGAIMYDHYKMPQVRGRNWNPRSTREEARLMILERIPRNSPGAQWLLKYGELKSLLKLRSSYVVNMYEKIDSDGRVHPDFLVYGTVTGRLSARDPAIQTIPRPGTGSALGDKWGAHIKAAFKPTPGTLLLSVDYSQAEMRTACALSGDEFLMDVYVHDRDLHSEVAVVMFGPDYDKDQRNVCKKFNFAFLYGGTEHSFAMDQGLDITVARNFVQKYQSVMLTLTEWRKTSFQMLKDQHYIDTMTKRRRRFPLITDSNMSDARKAAINHPVQGLASDFTLISLIEVHNWLASRPDDGTRLLITVHDSIILEAPPESMQEVASKVAEIMLQVAARWLPQVPWKVDAEVGPSWGELKPYELHNVWYFAQSEQPIAV